MDLETQNINKVRSSIAQIIRDTFTKDVPSLLQTSVGMFMNKGKRPEGKSKSDKLYIGTRRLYNSLMARNPENIYQLSLNDNQIDITYGTKVPYASIHETGGFIASKGRMHKYFWAKYYETKSPYYKYLALKVKKQGGVDIPARPYLNPGMEYFNEKMMPKVVENMIKKISKIL
jgi:phage gpG-like protein